MATKSAEQMRANVRTIRAFVAEAERVGIVVPVPLNVALSTAEAATDIGVAFEEVCKQTIKFEQDFEASLARKYDLNDWQQDDQAWIERAAYAHKWQARAVDSVLNVNNKESMAARLWKEWKPRIREATEDKTRSLVREFIDFLTKRRR